MFSHKHYVPILRSKRGEYNALRSLEQKSKKKISPFFKVVEVDRDRVTKLPKKTPQQHLSDISSAMAKSISGHIAVFVDLNDVEAVSYGNVDYKDVLSFFKTIKDASINVIPVRGVQLLQPYARAIKKLCGELETGLCLRLDATDFIDNPDLSNEIKKILDENSVAAKNCDILIDLEKLRNDIKIVDRTIKVINNFPEIKKWRTFTIASSAFPGSFEKGISIFSRDDFKYWRDIIKKGAELKRLPSYGDYGIQEPGWKASSGSFQGAVNLRYALIDSWLLFKGRKQKKDDGQFNGICRELVKRKEYGGAKFCWADTYIKDCALGKDGPGNGERWRYVGFNRHMTLTVNQLSNI